MVLLLNCAAVCADAAVWCCLVLIKWIVYSADVGDDQMSDYCTAAGLRRLPVLRGSQAEYIGKETNTHILVDGMCVIT